MAKSRKNKKIWKLVFEQNNQFDLGTNAKLEGISP